MTRLYDEERLGVLLRILRPAPRGWVRGGAGAARRSTCARRDRLAGRGGPRVPRGTRRRPRTGTRGRGLRARPPPPGRDQGASRRKLNGKGLDGSGPVESRPVQDVDAHSWDASKAALPAWSLPKDAVDRIALPADWPEHVTREWALGGSHRRGRPRLHPRLGRRRVAPAGRGARERRRHLDGRGRRDRRRARTRKATSPATGPRAQGSCGGSPPTRGSRASAFSARASRARERCCSAACATRSSRGSTSST